MEVDSPLSINTEVSISDNATLNILKSVVPKTFANVDHPDLSLMAQEIQMFISPLQRSFFFSVTNNSAGLDDVPVEAVLRFFHHVKKEEVYQLVRSSRGYSSRAIVQTIFNAAIETGDASIVDVLLRETQDIDINQQFCIVGGYKYTAIERASILRHEGLVKCLISHNADVNRTYSRCVLESNRKSAL